MINTVTISLSEYDDLRNLKHLYQLSVDKDFIKVVKKLVSMNFYKVEHHEYVKAANDVHVYLDKLPYQKDV